MKIVFNKSNLIFKIIIIVFILCETQFFYLLKLPYSFVAINSYRDKTLLVIFTFIILLAYILKSRWIIDLSNIIKSSVFLLLCVFIIVVFSSIFYNQSLIKTVACVYHYLLILNLIPLKKYCIVNEKNYKWLLQIIIISSVIFSTVLIVNRFFGIINLPYLSYLNIQFGRLTSASDFISFGSFLLLIYACEYNEFNFKYSVFLIINIVFLTFVSESRMYLLTIILLTIISVYVFFRERITKSNLIKLLAIIVFVCFLVIINLNTFNSIIKVLFRANRSISIDIRIQEILYYINHMFTNLFFGIGFIHDSNSVYYGLSHGMQGLYYTTDIGVIGFIGIFGLLGVTYLMWLCKIIFNYLKIALKNGNSHIYLAIIYFCLSMITSSYFDIQRIVFLPIIFLIFERTLILKKE